MGKIIIKRDTPRIDKGHCGILYFISDYVLVKVPRDTCLYDLRDPENEFEIQNAIWMGREDLIQRRPVATPLGIEEVMFENGAKRRGILMERIFGEDLESFKFLKRWPLMKQAKNLQEDIAKKLGIGIVREYHKLPARNVMKDYLNGSIRLVDFGHWGYLN